MTPVVNTRRLFARLLRPGGVATVCDVGSMDGSDAEFFRRHAPGANILAFEPNPRNFALMQAAERLSSRGIRVLPLAASDVDSEAPFYVEDARYEEGKDRATRGRSSLLRRTTYSSILEVVPVRTIRLDRFLASERLAEGPLALWIDAEGMAFEVIRGAQGVLDKTWLLHVEVETTACIGAEQRLFPDVLRNLEDAGFELLATDRPHTHPQFNSLFIRRDAPRRHASIRFWLMLARTRRSIGRLLRRIHA
jgi:FkbM family methyltransferase